MHNNASSGNVHCSNNPLLILLQLIPYKRAHHTNDTFVARVSVFRMLIHTTKCRQWNKKHSHICRHNH